MAGVKEISHTKLPASSIVEVSVAVAISSIVFGLAIGIYLNLLRSGIPSEQIRAEMLINEKYNEMAASNNYTSWTDEDEDLVIHCSVRQINDKNLVEVKLEVRQKSGRQLAYSKHLAIYQYDR